MPTLFDYFGQAAKAEKASEAAADGKGPLFFLTWNVNGLIQRIRAGEFAAFGEWVAANKPVQNPVAKVS